MINVLYSGFSYLHEDGLVYDTDRGRVGYDSYQMLYTHTPAYFWVDGELVLTPAKSVVLFTPGHRKYYTSIPGMPYTNDWIRFQSDEKYIADFSMRNVPFSPADPEYVHELFKLIAWESNGGNSKGENPNIQMLFRILFDKLTEGIVDLNDTPYSHELTDLRRDIMMHPEQDWRIEDMAARLRLSRTRFQVIYKQTFDITCMEDVIAARIRLAQERLSFTTLTISEIADRCGYRSTEHFCRQFKKVVGTTPGNYRKSVVER